jgi:hypothetical protein
VEHTLPAPAETVCRGAITAFGGESPAGQARPRSAMGPPGADGGSLLLSGLRLDTRARRSLGTVTVVGQRCAAPLLLEAAMRQTPGPAGRNPEGFDPSKSRRCGRRAGRAARLSHPPEGGIPNGVPADPLNGWATILSCTSTGDGEVSRLAGEPQRAVRCPEDRVVFS